MSNRNMTILGYYIVAEAEDGTVNLKFFETAAAADIEIKRMEESEYGEYALGDHGFRTLCQYHLDEAATEADMQRHYDEQRARQRGNGSDEDLFEEFDNNDL